MCICLYAFVCVCAFYVHVFYERVYLDVRTCVRICMRAGLLTCFVCLNLLILIFISILFPTDKLTAIYIQCF